ncbi:MAG TPA: flagellar basal body rod protein FlgC [Candidatus Marinimicrobia bacterium]|nr:flagellar basal body rod protein FlgC [Candidatus Neomarinimicrobiota bacterium]
MNTEGIFTTLRTSFSGLLTQMKKLETISENIANAEKIADNDGNVYKRKLLKQLNPSDRSSRGFGTQMALSLKKSDSGHLSSDKQPGISISSNEEKQLFKIVEVPGVKRIYDPSNPQADVNGYVNMPNISILEEMVEMISVSRNYEANVSVMTAAKQIAKQTLKI